MKREDFFTTWSESHGGAEISGIVKAWLNISYLIVKPLMKIRVTPNTLTLLGLFFGVALYLNAKSIWAPVLLVLSLTCDGVDGTLAIVSGKSSKWGAVLDSLVDRITEVFWVLALYKIGADLYLLIVVAVFALLQEYLRARAAGLGLAQVGIVTFAERPVRASFIFVSLIAWQLKMPIINQITLLWLLLQVVSFMMVSRFTYQHLN